MRRAPRPTSRRCLGSARRAKALGTLSSRASPPSWTCALPCGRCIWSCALWTGPA